MAGPLYVGLLRYVQLFEHASGKTPCPEVSRTAPGEIDSLFHAKAQSLRLCVKHLSCTNYFREIVAIRDSGVDLNVVLSAVSRGTNNAKDRPDGSRCSC